MHHGDGKTSKGAEPNLRGTYRSEKGKKDEAHRGEERGGAENPTHNDATAGNSADGC